MKQSKIAFISLILTSISTVCSIAGVYLIFNAAGSLQETKSTNQGNFILTLNRDFYTNDKLTNIRTALEENDKLLVENGGKFSDVEMDGYLGFFDTLARLLDKNILDYNLIDESYGYYIKETYDNKEIKDYIAWVDQKYGKDVYQGFKKLGKKISKEGY